MELQLWSTVVELLQCPVLKPDLLWPIVLSCFCLFSQSFSFPNFFFLKIGLNRIIQSESESQSLPGGYTTPIHTHNEFALAKKSTLESMNKLAKGQFVNSFTFLPFISYAEISAVFLELRHEKNHIMLKKIKAGQVRLSCMV